MDRRGFLARSMASGTVGGVMLGQSAQASGADGFYMPPEEAPHELTFMQWPVSPLVYDNPVMLRRAQRTIAEIANTIAAFEPVVMLAATEDHDALIPRLLPGIEVWDIPTEDLWCRDAGPIFVVNESGDRAVRQIQFNGWGNKQVHARDGQIASRVADRLGLALLPSGLIGEGGGVEHDGHGRLMAHESSWLNDNRNPGLTRDEIGARLLAAYGAEEIFWSPGVWGEDITDYHIDSLARFTGPGRVLMNLPDRPDLRDPFHVAALDTHDMLQAAGLEIEVIPEPTRPRVRRYDFVASYVNYYVCNGAVIAAQFGDPEADDIAYDTLTRHYPDREILMLNVDALGELGGGIHCATQQMPAGI